MLLGFTLWLALRLAQAIMPVLLQLLIAIILATGLIPLVRWLQDRGVPRPVSVLLIYLLLLVALVVFGFAVVPPVISQIEALVVNAPAYGDMLVNALQEVRARFPFLPPMDVQVADQLRDLGSQVGAIATQAVSVARFVLGIFSGVLSVLLVLVLTLYLIVDGGTTVEYLLSFAPQDRRDRVRRVARRSGQRMGGWLLGQVTLSLVVGAVSYAGLALIGVEGALLLAVIAAVGEAIPIIGPIAAAIPAVIAAFVQSPTQAIATVVLYILIQQLENNLLVPKIMERAVKLSPLAVIVALLIGSELLGVSGAIIAVPVAAALAVILNEFRQLGEAET